MKKLSLLSLLITMLFSGYSQSQRLVLLEHFTQASCGPCAQYNPSIHNLLVSNPDKITSINYHTSWPGYDPMYNQNPTDPSARVTYYGVSSVPHSVLDGNFFSGHPGDWNITTVNQRYAVPSPFTMNINQRLSATNDTLFVTMMIQATETVTGPITAHTAIIEKHIHFNTPPGSNGEKDFYNVLKKLLPTKNGVALPTPMMPGEYVILESYWVLANVYDVNELSVVGFIQNPTSKEVHQSANLMTEPITALHNNDVELIQFSNMIDRYCHNFIIPQVEIRNNGNNPLTSLEINYQVNQEEIQTYQWTGNLPFLGKAQIALPQVDFTMQDENIFKLYVSQVNQAGDEYTSNDTLVHNFSKAIQAGHNVQLKLRTDNAPSEVTWTILNSAGTTVASGGPYAEPGIMYTEDIVLPDVDCYEFYIYDSGGNGLCCGNGTGFFRLSSESNTIAQETQFGYEVAAQFDVVNVGIDNPSATESFSVYPNPATDQLWVEVPAAIVPSTVTIINQSGQKVFETNTTGRKIEINTASWPAGLYIVRMETTQGMFLNKISILK